MVGKAISAHFSGHARPLLKTIRAQKQVARLGGRPVNKRRKIAFESWRQFAKNGASNSTEAKENKALDAAAKEFTVGVKSGGDPDEIVRRQLGFRKDQDLSDPQLEYVEKVKTKLVKRSQELLNDKLAAFRYGELAYGKGEYRNAALAFQLAVDEAGPETVAGGEASLWLALAYQALGREEECIDLYKGLKKSHANKSVRKRADELLFIMEAPKLKLKKDEKVNMPVLKNLDRNTGRGTYGSRPGLGRVKPKKKAKKTFEDEYWENYEPPKYMRNKYFWVATSVLTVCAAWYSTVVNGGIK